MTAVICWSMKIRMVAKRAGARAASGTHAGFSLTGETNHPLSGIVGWNSDGTVSFGVLRPTARSTPDMERIAMMTAKSLMMALTFTGRNGEFRNSFTRKAIRKVPIKRRMDIRNMFVGRVFSSSSLRIGGSVVGGSSSFSSSILDRFLMAWKEIPGSKFPKSRKRNSNSHFPSRMLIIPQKWISWQSVLQSSPQWIWWCKPRMRSHPEPR